MNEKGCSSCRRYCPPEQIRRKRLQQGRVRLICLGCIERAKTRRDHPYSSQPEKTA